MEFFLKWALMASVQLAATMSPGPAFVMAVRSAMTYNRRAGIFTAMGLGLGVAAHVIFVLCGISLIISKSVLLYNIIKYAGAAYLVYVGVKALRSRRKTASDNTHAQEGTTAQEQDITALQALKMGFLTNLLNPKAVVFFTAVYTQFIDVHTPIYVHAAYGFTSVAIEFLWFAGVVIVLTNPVIKQNFMNVIHWIERGCGGLMIALGIKLALSK